MTAMAHEWVCGSLANRDCVPSRDPLLQHTRNCQWSLLDRSIVIRIGRLRRKVKTDARGEPRRIRAVRNGGSMFVPAADGSTGARDGAGARPRRVRVRMAEPHDRARALWPLPLAAALLPLLATVVAYALSIRLGLAPACNPFAEGCVSISRAARHDLPNILFRALVLPAAVLQAACWWLCPAWLRTLDAVPGRASRALPWLGLVAGVSLVLYGSFLGTEGEGYRWLRRYGTALYFGLSCIGMLVVADAMHRHVRQDRVRRRITLALLGLCGMLPLLGLAHVLVPLALPGEAAKDALQNATEWWGGAIFTAFFTGLAWAWRATGFGARLQGPDG